MNDTIRELLTRDNITLALSIFGALGTIFTIISTFILNRKNLSINIASCTNRYGKLYINMTFINKSRQPISVFSIKLKASEKIYSSLPYPENVGKYTLRDGNEIIDRVFTYTLPLPIDLQALGAASGYISFDVPKEVLKNSSIPLTLLVQSTRGTVQKIELNHTLIEYL